jgi:hypothetical protein
LEVTEAAPAATKEDEEASEGANTDSAGSSRKKSEETAVKDQKQGVDAPDKAAAQAGPAEESAVKPAEEVG